MNLKKLIADIRRDNKIPADELTDMLIEAMDKRTDDRDFAVCLYKKAYGDRLSKDLAMEWVHGMSVHDGSGRATGERWTMDETTGVGQRIGLDWSRLNKIEFYTAMNAMYSDMYCVAKEFELENEPLFFAHLAKSFWSDDDDVHDKTLLNYYFDFVA